MLALAALALAASGIACGDGVVIINVNSTGVIAAPPRCDRPAAFDLRDQGGLTVLVVITSNTRIVVAGGGAGTCHSLAAGDAVEVSGRRNGDRIIAGVVTQVM
jgi:hypothetical protein